MPHARALVPLPALLLAVACATGCGDGPAASQDALVPGPEGCAATPEGCPPPAEEACNGRDDDGDGEVDEGLVLDSNPPCAEATLLGAVRGDAGAEGLGVQDWREAWFRVEVKDDPAAQDRGFLGVMVTLSAQYPRQVVLEVHCPACGGVPHRTAFGGPGKMGVVLVGKEDAPGVDDSFEMLVHVAESGRSTGCGTWSLGVHGNQWVNATSWTCP